MSDDGREHDKPDRLTDPPASITVYTCPVCGQVLRSEYRDGTDWIYTHEGGRCGYFTPTYVESTYTRKEGARCQGAP